MTSFRSKMTSFYRSWNGNFEIQDALELVIVNGKNCVHGRITEIT